MKKQIAVLLLIISISGTAIGQDVSATCRTNMRVMKYFAGNWKGEAQITQQGAVVTVMQEENIEYRLDSLILQLDGVGRRKTEPGKISFHALGFVSYNAAKQNYEMKSFLMDGRQTDAYFKVIAKNNYEWGFDIPSGKIQYHITIDPVAKTWNEKGAFSADGKTWYPFFEMNLKKTKD